MANKFVIDFPNSEMFVEAHLRFYKGGGGDEVAKKKIIFIDPSLYLSYNEKSRFAYPMDEISTTRREREGDSAAQFIVSIV